MTPRRRRVQTLRFGGAAAELDHYEQVPAYLGQ
jgi:hypothetical protein